MGPAARREKRKSMSEATQIQPQEIRDYLGTGRRKTSVARVRLRSGQGVIKINGRPLEEYFPSIRDRESALAPLTVTGKRSEVDVTIRAAGGGMTGQADACKLGIARALKLFDTALYEAMRDSGMLTRDSRMKERKKYGLRGARRGTQFSKR
jgi:small subunit ribosomal protein S9